MDDLIASLECALDENGLPDAACQEAVALLRKQAARIAELEAERDERVKLSNQWMNCAANYRQELTAAEARADRLAALLKEAEERETALKQFVASIAAARYPIPASTSGEARSLLARLEAREGLEDQHIPGATSAHLGNQLEGDSQ